MIANRPVSNSRKTKDILVLNSVSKFHKGVINFSGFIHQTPSKMMNLYEHQYQAISPESIAR